MFDFQENYPPPPDQSPPPPNQRPHHPMRVIGCETIQVNLCQKLFFLQNMERIYCVQKLFRMSEKISAHNMFSPGLSLEFSCIELCNSMNNLSSYCGLVDAKIRASDKDLPVSETKAEAIPRPPRKGETQHYVLRGHS